MRKKTNLPAVQKLIKSRIYPVLNREEFKEIITSIKTLYGFMSMSHDAVASYLIKEKMMKKEIMTDNTTGHRYECFYPCNELIALYDIASVRSRSGYFSFYTALDIHDLTLQIPKSVYLTCERKNRILYKDNPLTQDNIDTAFRKKPRISSNSRSYKNYTVTLINGQCQNETGIIPFRDKYKVSDLERTLIDIAVRPFYAGGVAQVLEAYRNARKLLVREKMTDYYNRMDFIYPYHQVIGFYLEKAGYDSDFTRFFDSMERKYRFYLTYNIKTTDFSDKWNLYYPKGL